MGKLFPFPTSRSGVCDPSEGVWGCCQPRAVRSSSSGGVRSREAGPGSQPGWKSPRAAPPVPGPLAGALCSVPCPCPVLGHTESSEPSRSAFGEGKLNPVPAARGQGWECECGNRSRLRMTSRTEGRCWAARDLIQLGPAPIKMRSRRMGTREKKKLSLRFCQYCSAKCWGRAQGWAPLPAPHGCPGGLVWPWLPPCIQGVVLG